MLRPAFPLLVALLLAGCTLGPPGGEKPAKTPAASEPLPVVDVKVYHRTYFNWRDVGDDEDHAFAVPRRAVALHLDVWPWEGRNESNGTLSVLDPAGVVRGVCQGGERCDYVIPDATPGVWTMRYPKNLTSPREVRVIAETHGGPVWPKEATLLPERNGTDWRRLRFQVPENYPHVRVNVSFHAPYPTGVGPVVRVMPPTGPFHSTCYGDPTRNLECYETITNVAPGLWTIDLDGEVAGPVRVSASGTDTPVPPKPIPTYPPYHPPGHMMPEAAPPRPPTIVLQAGPRGEMARTPVPTPEDAVRLEVVLGGNGTNARPFNGSVAVLAPNMTVMGRIEGGPGRVVVPHEAAGRWWLSWEGDVPPDAYATVIAHLARERVRFIPDIPDPESAVLFRHEFSHDAPSHPRTRTFEVPPGARGLSAFVFRGPDPPFDPNATLTFRLLAPNESAVLTCTLGPCHAVIRDPPAGNWTARIEGEGLGMSRLHVVLTNGSVPRIHPEHPWGRAYARVHGYGDTEDFHPLGLAVETLLEVRTLHPERAPPLVRFFDRDGEVARCEASYCLERVSGSWEGFRVTVQGGEADVAVRAWTRYEERRW